MNKIGFKNFRRFIEFKPIEFNNITFLVGRNNSGKSTLVKAFLLIIILLVFLVLLDYLCDNVNHFFIINFKQLKIKTSWKTTQTKLSLGKPHN